MHAWIRILSPLTLLWPALLVMSVPIDSSAASDPPATEPPTSDEASVVDTADTTETSAAGDTMTGREIYESYVQGRSHESFQKIRIVSRDPGGSEQLSRFDMSVQDARDENGKPTKGVRLRSRLDIHDPFDMRHTKYLIITKEGGKDDEFIYQPSARRVRRVDLSETSFLGTDFTFGDLVVPEADDADHVRHPDEEIDGRPVFVVESMVKAGIETQYPRSIVYLEQEHYVPLRTRSWDSSDTEVKEMTAQPDTVRGFGDVWLATESTMRDLKQDTTSTLYVDELDPEPRFNRGVFSSGRLARGK
jgi:hypothetical protein